MHSWLSGGRFIVGMAPSFCFDLNSPRNSSGGPSLPSVMTGGFDVVLGNPPWERIKLQEQEFFAPREPEIAEAPNAAARAKLIAKLKEAAPGTRERALYEEFEAAKRTAEAASVFARVGGRFALTGRATSTLMRFLRSYLPVWHPNEVEPVSLWARLVLAAYDHLTKHPNPLTS